MSDDLKYIDDLFKEKLNDNAVASTQADITGASKIIGRFNFLHFSFNTFNIYYSILILLLVLTSVFYFGTNKTETAEYLKPTKISRTELLVKDIFIPVDTIDVEPIELVINDYSEKTIPAESDEPDIDNNIEKTAPVDSTFITKDEDINTLKDTMVIYKRVIIADTVRTIITKKVRPKKKNEKKD